ncbi:MAG: single-stranded-DNA-specific exonuclease RecJ [Ktedonobacteraceae bacterium]
MTQSALSPWRVYEILTPSQFQSMKQAGIGALHAQLLSNRGIKTPEAMRHFLDARYDQIPDPLTLIDMPRACQRIQQALDNREHITVYGDYDADGVTSSVLLTRALRALKQPDAPLDYYIPSRLDEGCGLNKGALDSLKARGTSLIITTDCSSSDVAQVHYAREALGIDIIITDHHQPPQERPAAYAMINPWRPDCVYGERYLCGVGIAFKLAQALYRAYKRPLELELELLDLVAIGTVADVASLLGENHTLVRLGMERLNRTQKPGLQALIRNAGLQPGHLRERDIAYALAPRINAAGRMEHASIAFELLATDDRREANDYAARLEQLNQARQVQTEELMSKVREEAELRPNDLVVLVSGEKWPEGIIGLVAGKLAEEINRPVLVLSRGAEFSRGSARSRDGFNIIHALRDCAPLLVRYGGHAQAAGFTIANDRIEDLRRHLLGWHESGMASAILVEPGEPDLTGLIAEPESAPPSQHMADLIFTRPEHFKYSTYNKIRQLSPFGAANPEPVFKAEGVRLINCWPSGVDGRNLRMRLGIGATQQVTGVLVRGRSQLSALNGVERVTIIFRLEPAWRPNEGESTQDISLKILHIEAQEM